MSMFYALMALCLSGSTLAQVVTSGGCPDVQVQQNFNISKLLGRWFEQARFYTLFEAGIECNTFEYTAEENNTFKVASRGNSAVTGKEQYFDSPLFVPDHGERAKMSLIIPMSPVKGHNNLWALGIDYNAWVVFFSCSADCSMNLQYAWILTKQQNPDESIMREANEVVSKNNLDPGRFLKTKQQGCGAMV